METVYFQNTGIFKALSDKNRLMIVDMLSCGELCGCDLLEKFSFTQPTLSHHMKILSECGLVIGRKKGKWIYYSLDKKAINDFKSFFNTITTSKKDCACNFRGECQCE